MSNYAHKPCEKMLYSVLNDCAPKNDSAKGQAYSGYPWLFASDRIWCSIHESESAPGSDPPRTPLLLDSMCSHCKSKCVNLVRNHLDKLGPLPESRIPRPLFQLHFLRRLALSTFDLAAPMTGGQMKQSATRPESESTAVRSLPGQPGPGK